MYKRRMKIEKEDGVSEICYFVKKQEESGFDVTMYTVGIEEEGKVNEVYDFSPSFEEAVRFCDYLYRENVTGENIFLMGEEFITFLGI